MKYSKIVLGLLVSTTVVSLGCNNSQTITPTKDVVSSNSQSANPSVSATNYDGSLEIISSPKAPNPSGILESPPIEPTPLPSASPFIIGKAPQAFGAGSSSGSSTSASPTPSSSGSATASPDPSETVVSSKVSGTVYGYNPTTKRYVTIPKAQVSIGGTLVQADDGGKYTLNEEVSTLIDISATADAYVGSTVKNVAPGENRDIHLQPLDNRKQYNSNTINLSVELLGAADANNVQYPRILSFADASESRFVPYLINAVTGKYRVEINPIAGNATAKGKLFV